VESGVVTVLVPRDTTRKVAPTEDKKLVRKTPILMGNNNVVAKTPTLTTSTQDRLDLEKKKDDGGKNTIQQQNAAGRF
jgi:hypothetical protein